MNESHDESFSIAVCVLPLCCSTSHQRVCQRFFGHQRQCSSIPNDGCETDLELGAGHDPGDFNVTVLNRYKLSINGSTSTFSDLGFESGETGVLAVDYLDNEVRILRETNTYNDSDLQSTTINRWLTVNDSDVF